MDILLLITSGPGALDGHEVTRLLLALGVLLLAARALGELARYFGYPTVLGELSAGILLGPALVGRWLPDVNAYLFPSAGASATVLAGLSTLSVTLFLLVAGLEVELSRVVRRGKAASIVGLLGIAVPFGVGWMAAHFAPELLGYDPRASHTVFALFVATALSISALPVIAKTLMDLRLYKTDFGMIVIASAIFNDLAGWIVFAIILGMMQTTGVPPNVWTIMLLALGFAVAMLTIGRWIVHRTLPWVQAHTAWPGGVIVFSISVALGAAALTEWIGIHAIFGAFFAGVALGDSAHLRERTRATVAEFVSSFFAPLFFAMVGLRVDFVTHFDWVIVSVVIVVACVGKILGCGVGARLVGMVPREAMAIGLAMNARGSMEIILGLTAFENGLIGERLLVALVVMALVTSVMSGPLILRALGRRTPQRFARSLSAKAFVRALKGRDKRAVVRELSGALSLATGIDARKIEAAVWEHDESCATVAAAGIAIPCAQIEGLDWPVIAFGMSRSGLEFEAPDGEPCSLAFLVLTPIQDPGARLEIQADIERTLKDASLRAKLLDVRSYTELLALLRADGAAR